MKVASAGVKIFRNLLFSLTELPLVCILKNSDSNTLNELKLFKSLLVKARQEPVTVLVYPD